MGSFRSEKLRVKRGFSLSSGLIMSDSCNPMDCSLPGSSSPGKNTGVGCHFLLQEERVRWLDNI